MKINSVTFEGLHDGKKALVTFEYVGVKEWKITLVWNGKQKTVRPTKRQNVWPCMTHAMALADKHFPPPAHTKRIRELNRNIKQAGDRLRAGLALDEPGPKVKRSKRGLHLIG